MPDRVFFSSIQLIWSAENLPESDNILVEQYIHTSSSTHNIRKFQLNRLKHILISASSQSYWCLEWITSWLLRPFTTRFTAHQIFRARSFIRSKWMQLASSTHHTRKSPFPISSKILSQKLCHLQGYTSDDRFAYSWTNAPKSDGLSIRFAGRSNSFASPVIEQRFRF